MTGKYLVVLVVLVGVCLGGVAVYVWQGGQTAQTGENAQIGENTQPESFISISELTGNPENFDNKTVSIQGTIASLSTQFGIEDNTGAIYHACVHFTGNLLYDKGENVIVTGLVTNTPFMSYGSGFSFSVENITKADENIGEFVEIGKIGENIENYDNKTVTIKGTITNISTHLIVSDNIGDISCASWGERVPYNVFENVVVEGRFYGYRYLSYPENIWTTYAVIEDATIEAQR